VNGPTIQNGNSARATVVAPIGSTVYQLLLTVTDTEGRTDSAPVLVTAFSANSAAPANAGQNACLTPVSYSVTAPPTETAASSGSTSGGGGGALDLLTLGALGCLGALAARRHTRRSAASSHSRCARR
jgi:hypothetical protein